MTELVRNLKVLLWKNKEELPNKSYPDYIDYVAIQCQMTSSRFRDILTEKVRATSQEQGALRIYFEDYGYDLSTISTVFLFDELIKAAANELMEKNLRYLFGTFERGENIEFAKALDINPSTLTRWKQGVAKPERDSLQKICKYFGLQGTEVLRSELLFLDIEPISIQRRKEACKKLIDNMDKEQFDQLYPAIQKLLN